VFNLAEREAPPYLDPTANVLQLVEAAMKRQDDLRQQQDKHTQDLLNVHFNYIQRLSDAEAKRIDAMRALDVKGVEMANERATSQASLLAGNVVQSADTLRSLVATTAAATATQQQQERGQMTERITLIEKTQSDRIALLEKAQYQTQGRDTSHDTDWSRVLAVVMAVIAVGAVLVAIFK
jgi:hypothetical protein